MSAVQITEAAIVAACTFREWFSTLGGTRKMRISKAFTLEDYDLCVLNSLNEDVRRVLTRKKVTLSDVINTVEKNIELSVINAINARIAVIKNDVKRVQKNVIRKRKINRKPMLNNDIFDDGEGDNSNFLVEEKDGHTASNTEENEYDDSTITVENQVEENTQESLPIYGIDDQNFECDDIVEEFDTLSDFPVLQGATSIGCSYVSVEELCVDDCSYVSIEELRADDDEGKSQEWDVVSDLLSVKSIDTLMTNTSIGTLPLSTSYKNMLLKAATPKLSLNRVVSNLTESTDIPPVVKTDAKHVDKTMVSIAEEVIDNDTMHDAHWERDGFKNGRGGKLGKLFKY